MNPENTRKFLDNAFRDGEIKTAGTDIDKLMPPVSRFGGSGRAQKKQVVIDKLKVFFDKYFGMGGSDSFMKFEYKTAEFERHSSNDILMVADKMSYGGDESKR